jgi:hypothetical protein
MKRIGYFYANPKNGFCKTTQHNSLIVHNNPNDFEKAKGFVIMDVWFEDVLKGLTLNANYFFDKKCYIKFKDECLLNDIHFPIFDEINNDEIPDEGGIGIAST